MLRNTQSVLVSTISSKVDLKEMKMEIEMKNKKIARESRRDFIKMTGLGVGAAAAVGASLKAGSVRADEAPKVGKQSGYEETEHVRKYYELARI